MLEVRPGSGEHHESDDESGDHQGCIQNAFRERGRDLLQHFIMAVRLVETAERDDDPAEDDVEHGKEHHPDKPHLAETDEVLHQVLPGRQTRTYDDAHIGKSHLD